MGRGATLRRAILDKYVRVAPQATIDAAALPEPNTEVVLAENNIVCVAKGVPYAHAGELAER